MDDRQIPDSIRKRVFDAYGEYCIYCGSVATEIDHIIPWAWTMRHDFSNLVPACKDCNLIASDKMFRSFEAKADYIIEKRSLPKWVYRLAARKSICTDCGLPYKPRVNGSTMFLCSHCADLATKLPYVREAEMFEWMKFVRQYRQEEEATMEREVKKARDEIRQAALQAIFDDE